jgi:hypothetical protein
MKIYCVYLSISPKTTSNVPIMATISGIRCNRL